ARGAGKPQPVGLVRAGHVVAARSDAWVSMYACVSMDQVRVLERGAFHSGWGCVATKRDASSLPRSVAQAAHAPASSAKLSTRRMRSGGTPSYQRPPSHCPRKYPLQLVNAYDRQAPNALGQAGNSWGRTW